MSARGAVPALATLTLLAAPASGQELEQEVRAFLAPLVERHLLSGIVLVGDRESIRCEAGFGHANDDARTPIDADTRFLIGSVTKSLTAAGVLLLRGAGMVDLGDPLSDFEPEFPRADEVTPRQLLLHRSGVGSLDAADAFAVSATPIGLDELVARIAERPFQFDPGRGDRYSNSGYALLARVIERASDTPYARFLAENIHAPLGMTRSGDLAAQPNMPGLATGYVPAPEPDRRHAAPPVDPGHWIGSGSGVSTARDLLAWARAVADDWPAAWLELEWPYGWGRIEVGGSSGLEQTGAVTGFMSSLIVLPEADTFVVVLLNQEFGGWAKVGRGVAELALGRAVEPFSFPAPVEPTAELRALFVGTYEHEGNTIRIVARDGHLWQHWNDWPVARYLQPISASEGVVPADNGVLRVSADSLTWSFGPDDGTVYTRRP